MEIKYKIIFQNISSLMLYIICTHINVFYIEMITETLSFIHAVRVKRQIRMLNFHERRSGATAENLYILDN